MDPAISQSEAHRFDAFELDPCGRELRKHGRRLRLQEHPYRILTMLLEHAGEVVTRDELRRLLWPDGTVVDFDNGLNTAVGKLRQALRDSADNPKYIETIPRQGYRFIGVLEPLRPSEPALLPVPLPPGQSWRLLVSLALAAVLVAAGIFGLAGIRSHTRHRLIVLPFQNYDRNADQQYLADGLTEEMTTRLSRLDPQRLGVIARTSAMLFRSGSKSIAQIRRDLDVDYVLEGSVRRSGDRVRVTAQLIHAADESHIWAGDYDRDLGDVLTLEAELSRTIADHIRVELTPGAKTRLEGVRSVNPRAYEALLKGKYFLWTAELTGESAEKAAAYFRQAIDADAGLAEAYAALAEYSLLRAQVTAGSLQANVQAAKGYTARALAIDPALPEAHLAAALIATMHDREWAAAGREFRETLRLDPNLARARAFHGVYLLAIGKPKEGLQEVRRAQELDPLALAIRAQVPRACYLAHQYRQAIAEAQKKLEMNPGYVSALENLAQSYEQLGSYDDAAREFRKALAIAPTRTEILGGLGHVLAVSGHRDEALNIIETLRDFSARGFFGRYQIAVVYAGLGNAELAIQSLQEAYEAPDYFLNVRLRLDPKLDNLRSDPRFQDLIRRMNYPQ